MKVGDYARTINGIVKISEIKNGRIKDDEDRLHFGDFIKSSPNIIDLIEVGDYVNGNVVKKLNGELVIMNTGLIYDGNLYLPIKKINIKSIVTKEQFSCMEYKIGE